MEVYKSYVHKLTPVKAYQATRQDVIHTLEGDMIVHPGSYVVKGVRGELYPVHESVFHQLYEEVKE